jgi:ABC-type Fe3+/spermidine/putrescine transport system ATPase subunit
LLRLEAISHRLGNFSLRNVSMEVREGEYLVLLGPTGTGKTVLLETIAGLHRPDGGKIFLNDRDITCLPPEKRHLGVVYQDYALFPHLTVYGNIAFGLKLQGKTGDLHGTVSDMAEFLDIRHILNRKPGRLSGGERQRVALARALALNPYLLLLDEPLSALDRITRDRLRRELKRIHGEIGVSVLHITHDLSEAFFLADRLIIMKDGAIVQEGEPEEILRRPENRFAAELVGIENFVPAVIGPGQQVFLECLGCSDPPLFQPGSSEKAEKIYLTIPGWAVDLFPEKEENAYFTQVDMQVSGLNYSEGHMEIELTHEQGGQLRTTLSRREATVLPVELELGKVVRVGLLKEGTHWVPGE